VLIEAVYIFTATGSPSPNAFRIAANARFGLEVFEAAVQMLGRLLRDPPEEITV
jgi:hypothetical protein